MKRAILLLGLLFCFTGYSQQKLKKADKLFAGLAYVDAAKAYEDYLQDEKQPGAQTIKNAADAYYFTGNMDGALRWYTRLHEMAGASMDDTYFNRYIQSLRAGEHYEKADQLLKERLERKGDKQLIARFNRQKKHLDSLNASEPQYTLSNLAINSDKADFGTAFYGDRIVYSSSKDTGGKMYSWNEQPFLDLYVAERNAADGSFTNEMKFIPDEQTRYHNATLTFTPDLETVYYSANNVNKNDRLDNSKSGTNNIEIIRGTIKDSKLSGAKGVPFNSKEYSVGHPALSPDGKQLFFVSDMPGGYGETDIYVAEVSGTGTLGKPKNLGPVINTPGREMFPFVADDALYFASDGHYGLGGLDIFESNRGDKLAFSEPKNLGKPVNSNLDDFSFIIDQENKYGYLSSNRQGGKGDDDIYYFTKAEKPCTQWMAGRVMNRKYEIGINQAAVTVYNQFDEAIATVKTNEDGSYRVEVPCNAKVRVEATKPDHNKGDNGIETSGKPGAEIKVPDFVLSDYDDLIRREDNMDKIDINPIFFDFDKWDITPQAVSELEKVVYVMKNFPSVVIKIESHTDCRGSDEYNIVLSANRAKSTYDYLLSRGIEASRIESVNGYGETRLRNKCSNGVDCSEAEHLVNRRSDFIIVKR